MSKMNEIVNKLLLSGESFLSEMHLRQPAFTVLVGHLLKTKKKYKNSNKREIRDIFIKTK